MLERPRHDSGERLRRYEQRKGAEGGRHMNWIGKS
jgi:hypothetical protein